MSHPGKAISRKCLNILIGVTSVLLLGRNSKAQSQEIRVAAAADLNFAMADLAAQFEKETGIKVNVTSGSSGNFFSQIQNGAPFDLFFSADMEYSERLAATGFAEPETLRYALGRIVIWTPAGAKVDVPKQGWNALLDASVQKIAVANPELAPYGRAAVSALQRAGIYDQVKQKLIYGENVSQAAQFVQSGNAQAGIIALSLAVSPGMKAGQFWEIPREMYPSIEQGAVVLKTAKDKRAAHAFLDFVRSSAGREILQQHGFATPAAK